MTAVLTAINPITAPYLFPSPLYDRTLNFHIVRIVAIFKSDKAARQPLEQICGILPRMERRPAWD